MKIWLNLTSPKRGAGRGPETMNRFPEPNIVWIKTIKSSLSFLDCWEEMSLDPTWITMDEAEWWWQTTGGIAEFISTTRAPWWQRVCALGSEMWRTVEPPTISREGAVWWGGERSCVPGSAGARLSHGEPRCGQGNFTVAKWCRPRAVMFL